MKYHLQTRLESINPTQKPKNGILLSKEPLRRHPWHGNDWEGRNCWTWWKLMWRKTWCDDSWPWTAFSPVFSGGWRDTRWIFILLKSEICNSTKSTAKRSRDCNSTPPPSYGSYPNCPNRSRWTAGWCSGFVAFLSFPCKQDSTTNFEKHPNPGYTGQAMVGKNDSVIAGRSWSFPNRMCWDWWRFWRLHE